MISRQPLLHTINKLFILISWGHPYFLGTVYVVRGHKFCRVQVSNQELHCASISLKENQWSHLHMHGSLDCHTHTGESSGIILDLHLQSVAANLALALCKIYDPLQLGLP